MVFTLSDLSFVINRVPIIYRKWIIITSLSLPRSLSFIYIYICFKLCSLVLYCMWVMSGYSRLSFSQQFASVVCTAILSLHERKMWKFYLKFHTACFFHGKYTVIWLLQQSPHRIVIFSFYSFIRQSSSWISRAITVVQDVFIRDLCFERRSTIIWWEFFKFGLKR